MRAGKNVWMCVCGHEWKATKKDAQCPKCGDVLGFGAKYPESRIHGDKYEYYEGKGDWVRDANRGMGLAAHDNFNR